MKWGMAVDLRRCIGCSSCVLACKAEHFLPPDVFWNRVLVSESGVFPAVTKLIYPVRCNQCQEPKCVKSCPTGATLQREDGIVQINEEECVGCRYCMIACPYQARVFYEDNAREYFPGQGISAFEEMGRLLYPHEPGIIQKCNFCLERIDAGLRNGLRPGIDRDATPACVISCPTKAMHFGDLNDPYSDISRLIKEKKARPFHPEFDTEPSIFYIE